MLLLILILKTPVNWDPIHKFVCLFVAIMGLCPLVVMVAMLAAVVVGDGYCDCHHHYE